MSLEVPSFGAPAGKKEEDLSKLFSFSHLDVKSLLEKSAEKRYYPDYYKSAEELLNLSDEEIKTISQEAFERLSEYEQTILVSRFHTTHEAAALKDVGNAYSVTGENIRQLETKAMGKFCRHISSILEHKNGNDDLYSLGVEALDISTRSRNVLKNLNVRTVGDLVNKTEKELLKAKNSGKKSVEEIKLALDKLGLHSKTEEEIEQEREYAQQFIDAGLTEEIAKEFIAKRIYHLEDIVKYTEEEVADLLPWQYQVERVKNAMNEYGLEFKQDK